MYSGDGAGLNTMESRFKLTLFTLLKVHWNFYCAVLSLDRDEIRTVEKTNRVTRASGFSFQEC